MPELKNVRTSTMLVSVFCGARAIARELREGEERSEVVKGALEMCADCHLPEAMEKMMRDICGVPRPKESAAASADPGIVLAAICPPAVLTVESQVGQDRQAPQSPAPTVPGTHTAAVAGGDGDA